MFREIVSFSIRKKMFVVLTTLLLLAGGIYSMLTLPIDAVPDITNNQVQIVTVSPTLAPQEVEQLITFPIEIAMSNPAYTISLSIEPAKNVMSMATPNFRKISIKLKPANADIFSCAIKAALYGTLIIVMNKEITENWNTQKAAVKRPSGMFS